MSRRTRALAAGLVAAVAVAPVAAAEAAPKKAKPKTTAARLAEAEKTLKQVRKQLADVRAQSARTSTDLGGLQAAVGPAMDGLNQMKASSAATKDALGPLRDSVTTIGNALGPIKDNLTTLAGGLTTASSGLKALGEAVVANEHGVARVFMTGATAAGGQRATSPDVPDDGNAAQADGTALFLATGTTSDVTLRADLRSSEADAAADSGPAGQAGGYVFVRDLTTGALAPCAAPFTTGVAATTPGAAIVTAAGTVTNLPYVNLPGVARTDQAGPTASSTALLGSACTVTTTAGHLYGVSYVVQFLDLPTSTSPKGTD